MSKLYLPLAKEKKMFYWLKEKRFHIYFLQEVHCTTDQADQ